MKHAKKNTANSSKKAVKERPIFQKERTKCLINGKNTMAMSTANEFKRHLGGAIDTVFIATGRTKLRVTAKRNEFKLTTMRASIHGAAKRRIPAIYHSRDVL